MRLHSEKPPCPRRGKPKAAEAMLSRSLAERGGKAECRAEESDRYPARCWGSRVASQPLLKAETIMRTLRTGKGRRRESWAGRTPGLHLHLHLRLPEQLLARTSMVPTTPVSPKQGRRPNDEGRQEHTHPTRLGGGFAMPLTLLAQKTGTATADAGRIHDAQASVSLGAPLLRNKRLTSRTAQRSIRLEGKVSTREAALFPGQGHGCRSIPLGGRRQVSRLFACRRESGSKLGGAHGIRMKLMAQFQAQVPHPLADDLPCLLTTRGVTTPAIRVLLQVFIGQSVDLPRRDANTGPPHRQP